jgi:hypothetical protein
MFHQADARGPPQYMRAFGARSQIKGCAKETMNDEWSLRRNEMVIYTQTEYSSAG